MAITGFSSTDDTSEGVMQRDEREARGDRRLDISDRIGSSLMRDAVGGPFGMPFGEPPRTAPAYSPYITPMDASLGGVHISSSSAGSGFAGSSGVSRPPSGSSSSAHLRHLPPAPASMTPPSPPTAAPPSSSASGGIKWQCLGDEQMRVFQPRDDGEPFQLRIGHTESRLLLAVKDLRTKEEFQGIFGREELNTRVKLGKPPHIAFEMLSNGHNGSDGDMQVRIGYYTPMALMYGGVSKLSELRKDKSRDAEMTEDICIVGLYSSIRYMTGLYLFELERVHRTRTEVVDESLGDLHADFGRMRGRVSALEKRQRTLTSGQQELLELASKASDTAQSAMAAAQSAAAQAATASAASSAPMAMSPTLSTGMPMAPPLSGRSVPGSAKRSVLPSPKPRPTKSPMFATGGTGPGQDDDFSKLKARMGGMMKRTAGLEQWMLATKPRLSSIGRLLEAQLQQISKLEADLRRRDADIDELKEAILMKRVWVPYPPGATVRYCRNLHERGVCKYTAKDCSFSHKCPKIGCKKVHSYVKYHADDDVETPTHFTTSVGSGHYFQQPPM